MASVVQFGVGILPRSKAKGRESCEAFSWVVMVMVPSWGNYSPKSVRRWVPRESGRHGRFDISEQLRDRCGDSGERGLYHRRRRAHLPHSLDPP